MLEDLEVQSSVVAYQMVCPAPLELTGGTALQCMSSYFFSMQRVSSVLRVFESTDRRAL